MFISVGKMFGKGKLRFGVGIRITKKNFWWMALVAVFYWMFLLMWYMILGCAWLVYAMFYAIWWCIKKLFRLGSKKKTTKQNNISSNSMSFTNNIQPSANESMPVAESTSLNINAPLNENLDKSDYAKAVFLWGNQTNIKARKRNEYPSYLFYECGIQDGARYFETMIKEGYLIPSSLREKLSGLKMDELKEILQSHELSVTGKKADLIERIVSNVPEEEMPAFGGEETYSLSDIGKKYLTDHNDCVLVHTHKNWGIDWNEFSAAKSKCPGTSFYDVCWGIFIKRLNEEASQRLLGRNEYNNMYQLLIEEKRYKDALCQALRVLYIDLSGYNANRLDSYRQGIYQKADLKRDFQTSIMIAPGIIKEIGDLQEYYDPEMARKVADWQLPFNACSPELYLNIVQSIMDGSFDEESTLKRVKEGYNRAVDQLA